MPNNNNLSGISRLVQRVKTVEIDGKGCVVEFYQMKIEHLKGNKVSIYLKFLVTSKVLLMINDLYILLTILMPS